MRDIGVTGVQTCALPISASGTAGRSLALAWGCTGPPPASAPGSARTPAPAGPGSHSPAPATPTHGPPASRPRGDRKSVVLGKSVDLGGRCILKNTQSIV